MMKSFVDAVQELVKAADWIGPEDQVAVVSLMHMAKQLDNELSGPILNAFGLVYRNLLKRKPGENPEVDELELLLR